MLRREGLVDLKSLWGLVVYLPLFCLFNKYSTKYDVEFAFPDAAFSWDLSLVSALTPCSVSMCRVMCKKSYLSPTSHPLSPSIAPWSPTMSTLHSEDHLAILTTIISLLLFFNPSASFPPANDSVMYFYELNSYESNSYHVSRHMISTGCLIPLALYSFILNIYVVK